MDSDLAYKELELLKVIKKTFEENKEETVLIGLLMQFGMFTIERVTKAKKMTQKELSEAFGKFLQEKINNATSEAIRLRQEEEYEPDMHNDNDI